MYPNIKILSLLLLFQKIIKKMAKIELQNNVEANRSVSVFIKANMNSPFKLE